MFTEWFGNLELYNCTMIFKMIMVLGVISIFLPSTTQNTKTNG